jgi:hypothetical protein
MTMSELWLPKPMYESGELKMYRVGDVFTPEEERAITSLPAETLPWNDEILDRKLDALQERADTFGLLAQIPIMCGGKTFIFCRYDVPPEFRLPTAAENSRCNPLALVDFLRTVQKVSAQDPEHDYGTAPSFAYPGLVVETAQRAYTFSPHRPQKAPLEGVEEQRFRDIWGDISQKGVECSAIMGPSGYRYIDQDLRIPHIEFDHIEIYYPTKEWVNNIHS